ncbi:hypothetical protein [Sulfitobacter sp. HI0021]|uniref:hypothetical protein n=1 Tax=unclassified Sulfitobacter TaxID=196795 RepID=UPI003FCD1000
MRSNAVVRFMDDFVLFSDSRRDLRHDFITIQRLLGEKGLSLNPNKTSDGVRENVELEDAIEDVRIQLLQRRRVIITDYDGIPDEEVEVEQDLSDEEMGFLRGLLQQDDIEEEDAELVLALMAGVCVILCPDAFSYAMGKRSSNMMASWLLTRCHSRTDRFHSTEVALSAK